MAPISNTPISTTPNGTPSFFQRNVIHPLTAIFIAIVKVLFAPVIWAYQWAFPTNYFKHLDIYSETVCDLSDFQNNMIASQENLNYETEKVAAIQDLERDDSTTLTFNGHKINPTEFIAEVKNLEDLDKNLPAKIYFCLQQGFLAQLMEGITIKYDTPISSQDGSRSREILANENSVVITHVYTNYFCVGEIIENSAYPLEGSNYFTFAYKTTIDRASKNMSCEFFVIPHSKPTTTLPCDPVFKKYFSAQTD